MDNTTDNDTLSDTTALRLLVMLGGQMAQKQGDHPMSRELVAFATKWLKETPLF
jgi:hypothetical protein